METEPLHEYELGDEARAFIRHELDFDRGLARWLRGLPIEQGQVAAFLRPDLTAEVLNDFDSEGFLSGQENLKVTELVHDYLRAAAVGKRIGVFCGWWDADAPFLERVVALHRRG